MKRVLLLTALTISFFTVNAQSNKTSLELKDTAYIAIQQINVDSFPSVKVRFTAETQKGFAFWNVAPEKILVKENKTLCKVTSFKSLTRALPLQVCLVLDQSGSMLSENFEALTYYDILFGMEKLKRNSPLTKAKKAIGQFLSSFNSQKDSLTILAFATRINLITPHTNDTRKLQVFLDKVDLEDGTSFYDVLYTALDTIATHEGLQTIIALTDGMDTHSRRTLEEVTEKAKTLNIPIYVIGLGNVDHKTLSKIALETNGEFLYTTKASTLPQLYEKIDKKLKAVYELDYLSENFSPTDTARIMSIDLESPGLVVQSKEKPFVLSNQVIHELVARERTRGYTYYSLAGAGIIGLIALLIRKRKKTKNI